MVRPWRVSKCTIGVATVQVRKSYEEKRRRRRARGQQRAWKLKRMAMELGEEGTPSTSGRGRDAQRGGPGRQDQDMERFMQVGFRGPRCRVLP